MAHNRKIVTKILLSTTLLLIVLMWTCFTTYWGSRELIFSHLDYPLTGEREDSVEVEQVYGQAHGPNH